MGVSENSGTPKSSIFVGFSIIFTIHFGVPDTSIFGNIHIVGGCWRVLLPQVGLTTLSFLHKCILIFMGLDVDLPFPVGFPERLIGIEISIYNFRIILDTISVECLPAKTTCLIPGLWQPESSEGLKCWAPQLPKTA